MCDDIFDDLESDTMVLETSWKRNVEDINKEGYREGLEAGKEESVQEGFNKAFAVSSKLLFQVAKLRGNISGRLSVNLLKPGALKKETESKLQDLLQDVCSLESELLNFSKETLSHVKQTAGYCFQPLKEQNVNNDADIKLIDINQGKIVVKKDGEDFTEKQIEEIMNIPEQSFDNDSDDHREHRSENKILKVYDESESIKIDGKKAETTERKALDLCITSSIGRQESDRIQSDECDNLENCDKNVRQDRHSEWTTDTNPMVKKLEKLIEQYKTILD